MKFKKRKTLTIGSAIGFGFLVALSFGLFVRFKTPHETIPNYFTNAKVDYKKWAKDRVAARQAATNKVSNDSNLNAVKLKLSSTNSGGITKDINATSIEGTAIYRYGRAIFSIDDTDIAKKITKTTDLYHDNYRLSAANMMARILQVAGYRPSTQASNTSYTVTKQDALNYIGKFLNENQPFYGPTLSFNPISIINDSADTEYVRNTGYYDENWVAPDYSVKPQIAMTNLFGDTLDLFFRRNYSPNSLDDVLTEDTKWANSLSGIISSDMDNPFKSLYIYNASNEAKVGYANIFQDFFAANNNDDQFAYSYTYKKIIATDNINNQNQPVFKILGNSVDDIKKKYAKYMQKIAISFLQNLKFCLLQLTHIQITKHALSNLQYQDQNQLIYGPRLGPSSYIRGYKKGLYEKFKQIFTNYPFVKDRIFGYLVDQPNNIIRILSDSVALMKNEYYSWDIKSDQYQHIGEDFYHPVYVWRSISNIMPPESILYFSLISYHLPFSPVLFNPKTGLYDSENVDTDHLLVVGSTAGPYTDRSDLETNSSSQIIKTNKWYEQSFYLKDKYYAIDSEDWPNSGTIDPTIQEKKSKFYKINNIKKGMNIFTSQFYPFIRILAQKEIDFYTDPNNKAKFDDRNHDPATEPTLRRFRLDNLMQNVYTDFNIQSRAKLVYYLNSSGQRLANDNFADVDLKMTNTKKEISHSVNSLANAYTFWSICLEIFKNVSDYASTLSEYNNNKTKEGIIHWTSIDQFDRAFSFYMIQLGGARKYKFRDSYLKSNETELYTGSINRYNGPDFLTLDGKTFSFQPSFRRPHELYALINLGWYEGFISTFATLLNYNFGDQDFYQTEEGNKTRKLDQQEIIENSSLFFHHLSVMQLHHKVPLFDNQGQLSDVSKKFIQLYEQEVLGSKYFVAQLLFNFKIDMFGNIYGYVEKNQKINSITNELTHKKLDSYVISPDIKWSNKIGRIDGQTYSPNDSINQKNSWVIPGFTFGIYKDTDFISTQNTFPTINPIKFDTNASINFKNIRSSFVNANGLSNLFLPIEFNNSSTPNVVNVVINKNWLIPN